MEQKVEKLNTEMSKFKIENERLKKLKLKYEDMVRKKIKLVKDFNQEQA